MESENPNLKPSRAREKVRRDSKSRSPKSGISAVSSRKRAVRSKESGNPEAEQVQERPDSRLSENQSPGPSPRASKKTPFVALKNRCNNVRKTSTEQEEIVNAVKKHVGGGPGFREKKPKVCPKRAPPSPMKERRLSMAVLAHMPSNRPLSSLPLKKRKSRTALGSGSHSSAVAIAAPATVTDNSATAKPGPASKLWQWAKAFRTEPDDKRDRHVLISSPDKKENHIKMTTKAWRTAVKERQQKIKNQQPATAHTAEQGVARQRHVSRIDDILGLPIRQERKSSISGLVHHIFGKGAQDDPVPMSTAEGEAMLAGKPATSTVVMGTFSERVGQYMNACRRGTIYIPLSSLEPNEAPSASGSDEDELDNLETRLDGMNEDQIEALRHKFKVLPTKMKNKKEYRRRLLAYEDMHGLGIMNDKNWTKMIKEEIQRKWANMDFTMWKKSFVLIESHFGTSTVAYFYFLRWLVYLNFAIALIQFLFIMLPQVSRAPDSTFTDYVLLHELENDSYARKSMRCSEMYGHMANDSTGKQKNDTASQWGVKGVLDLVQGTGFMERSPLFYGDYYNYTRVASDGTMTTYNMSMAYLLVTIMYFIISFICIMKSSGSGMTEMLSRDSETVHTTFTNKAFGSWDYCITDPIHARLTHRNITNDIQVDLNEKNYANMLRNRTHREIAKLIIYRVVVNAAVFFTLALSLVAIYYGTTYSVDEASDVEPEEINTEFMRQMSIKFLPSILTTLLNMIVPVIFEYLMAFEKYSLNMEVIILLARTVIVRLTLVGVLILSLYLKLQTNFPKSWDEMKLDCVRGSPLDVKYNCINATLEFECASKEVKNIMCWETHVGQQFYRLSVSEFIFTILNVILHEFPRRWIYMRYRENVKFVEYYLPLPFYIVYHVLDLIYCQSLCWFGAFFCPYISIWTMLKLFVYFYLRKLSLMKNCIPPVRAYRSSRSNAFFMKVLLLTFISCSVLVGYIFGNIQPSQSCGPFRVYVNENHTMTSTVTAYISTFSHPIKGTIHFLSSPAFIIPLLIVLTGTMYYNWTMGMFNIRYARQLKVDLALEGRDKQQLVRMIKDLDDQMREVERQEMAPDEYDISKVMEFTKDEAEEMLQAFKLFDRDNDGSIGCLELGPIMRALGLNPTERHIEKLLRKADVNKDGTIDYEEYTALMKEYTKSPEDEEEELKAAFLYFDHDRDGFISVKELVKALTVTGEKMDKKQVRNIIQQFDTDGDGKLGYAEFAKFLCQKY